MPLYDFGCEECGYVEEILTRSAGNAEIVLTCPECEKEAMKRQVGLSSFQLKGGGWYKDGYTKKPKVEKNRDVVGRVIRMTIYYHRTRQSSSTA